MCSSLLPLKRMRTAASATSNNLLSPKKGGIRLICNQVGWMHQILKLALVGSL